ncbi:hypothetical protein [Streptomyces sp. LUP30]|uniref:hypothetical protein n=1 Tax=Streptomyces sp. LUP30 TaxID=1890285 RepID=UPI0008516541|nr:hypothetical protein [Streptomyces sp. LUP30]
MSSTLTRTSVRLLPAVVVAAGFALATSGVASADSMRPYLSWDGAKVAGPCSGAPKPAGSITLRPGGAHSAKVTVRSSHDDEGHILMLVTNQNSVVKAAVSKVCNRGGGYHLQYNPSAYKHRTITQIWNCAGASCAGLPIFGAWKSGLGPI